MIDKTKRCSRCRVVKPLAGFGPDTRKVGRLKSRCKACVNAASREWQASNKERVAAAHRKWRAENKDRVDAVHREWRARNKERINATHRKRLYGLTAEAYEAMLKAQNHKCWLRDCDLRRLPSHKVHVDHCHETGVVRGIACHQCNLDAGRVERGGHAAMIDFVNRLLGKRVFS